MNGLIGAETFGENNGLFKGNAEGLITTGLYALLGFAGIIGVCALVWGGFLYLTAGVDEGNAKKGKQIIIWAITGLMIIGLSLLITNVILSTFMSQG